MNEGFEDFVVVTCRRAENIRRVFVADFFALRKPRSAFAAKKAAVNVHGAEAFLTGQIPPLGFFPTGDASRGKDCI